MNVLAILKDFTFRCKSVFEMCLENFTTTYDMNGFAKELKGKATPSSGMGFIRKLTVTINLIRMATG